ncbi:type II toxin-antitoxin system RelB/DinJ family antitoxin [Leuconostoc inhae]|mgnify:CR=1 FL=1|uniref:type II toxin-antitoxin system RelB/DinJ family antitoxin n=1 Tax=Leuconostoc inhae TaxID=178001 RepID=UPI001C7DF96A|nr:type II toxin-antitoxin system RelB/DinJ family antitoxin [Leuconostoc inhae]
MANITPTKEKKRIQIQLDREVADQAEEIIDSLGLNTTVAINMFFKSLISNGGMPFEVKLTPRQIATRQFIEATKNITVEVLDTDEKIQSWLDEDD